MSAVLEEQFEFWTSEKKQIYEQAIETLINQIEIIEDEMFKKSGNHSIRHIEKRLKSQESIEEKLRRKGKINSVDVETIMSDLAGVRVICFDTRQVYSIVKEIRKIREFVVIKEKDYISHPKDNGYQSYHMILEILGIKVELQIRTILMDAWSSLETVLIYKKTDIPPKEILTKIHKFSKWSKKIDHMVEKMLEEKEDEK